VSKEEAGPMDPAELKRRLLADDKFMGGRIGAEAEEFADRVVDTVFNGPRDWTDEESDLLLEVEEASQDLEYAHSQGDDAGVVEAGRRQVRAVKTLLKNRSVIEVGYGTGFYPEAVIELAAHPEPAVGNPRPDLN
jgi:hypothetical protein